MYILITLFLISLAGMLAMIMKKLAIVEDLHMMQMGRDYVHPLVPEVEKVKYFVVRVGKRVGHGIVVTILRLHVKTSHAIKSKSKHLVKKVLGDSEAAGNNKEASKFLKMISEYKHKVRELRHQIKEEENIL